jgi:hydroxymethylpyrimidine/phosphomethylpyrimidine kinase
MKGRVLIVAGSDSGGGAGIQADIKAVTMLGGYAATAITALTAQNTQAVYDVFPVPPEFIIRQIEVVLDDIGADCIKIGMLGNVPAIEAVADCLQRKAKNIPLVLDPVMVATSGGMLLATGAIEALVAKLFAGAALVTPNVPEAEALSGIRVRSLDDMKRAAGIILDMGPGAVLLKGGHLEGEVLTDILLTSEGVEVFKAPRINTIHTHGTGCTLASGIAVGLAQGMVLREAVMRARSYVLRALESAPGLGYGHGPINHCALLEVRPVNENKP